MARKLFEMPSNGVTRSEAFEEDGRIILRESMSGEAIDALVQANKDDAAFFRGKLRQSGAGGDMGVIGARMPITLHTRWRQEWRAGPRQHGVPWHLFLKRRLNSAEYKHLRFMKL